MRPLATNQPAVWVFTAALVLLVLTATVSEKVAGSYRESTELVTHTREVEVHIARARGALARTEAALMQEVISANRSSHTGDPLSEAEGELREFRSLTAGNPQDQKRLAALTRELNELRRAAMQTLATPVTAQSLETVDARFQTADEHLKQMRDEQEALLIARSQLSETEYHRMRVFFESCFLFAAFVLLWSSLDILRQSSRASRAEKAVKALNVQLQRAHDEEGKRIGRDLHDSIGQLFVALKMALSRVEARTDVPEDVRLQARLAMQVADEGTRETRTISLLLHPPMLEELGLAAAVGWFVKGFSERSGISVHLNLPRAALKLSPEVAMALFRAIQVGLGNIHRHAHSNSADVSFALESGTVSLEIWDYGAGIPKEQLKLLQTLPAAAGVGLGGLKERVEQLAGCLEITSDETGTCLRVRLPTG
jgi:signal transduction histidine kinase